MNNHLKKMLLVMVVTVSATAPAEAYAPSLYKVRFEQVYAALAKATSSVCGAAKDVVVESVGTVAEVVCNPVESLENLATVVSENPRRTLAVLAGTVLAYIAYNRYNNAQEKTEDETVNA